MAAIADNNAIINAFGGSDSATLDSKGRLLLNSDTRESLGKVFTATIGMRGCIYLYPGYRWQEQLREIEKYSPMSPARQKFSYMFYQYADQKMSCDTQGRVVIPQKLREVGKLKEKVIVLGVHDHLEVWDVEEYEKFDRDMDGYNADRMQKWLHLYEEMIKG